MLHLTYLAANCLAQLKAKILLLAIDVGKLNIMEEERLCEQYDLEEWKVPPLSILLYNDDLSM